MSHLEDLRTAVQAGRVVVIVGTGATLAATRGAPGASWPGLVASGAEFAERTGLSPAGWPDLIKTQLQMAESEDPDQLLQAAGQVSTKLRSKGPQAFSKWMHESVGALEIADGSWLDAILGLSAPVFTTNYDTFLESRRGAHTVTWKDPQGFQRIVAGSGDIGHLHGVYTDGDSVVLSEADYQRVLANESSQSIQRALSSTKSLLYVGCGSTLQDPNFSMLLDWHRQLFPESGITHYRLCLASELPAMEAQHVNDNIVPLVFGSSFGDLPGFLGALSPAQEAPRSESGIVRDAVADARAMLLEDLRTESLLSELMPDLETRSLDELLVAPVLLPVPRSEYYGSIGRDRPKRVDAREDAGSDGLILLVADDSGGLSSAIKWYLSVAAESRPEAAPILLDFRRFPRGLGPLKGQVSLEALRQGLIRGRKDPLPPLIVGIDDFHGRSNISLRTVEDIQAQSGLVLVGCRSQAEAEVREVLSAAGLSYRVRYLGAFARQDVRAMVSLSSAVRADAVAASVWTTVQAEHLPRTPFTIALLIAIIARGEALVANASPTSLLEQYVSHLLGRNEGTDARRGLTSVDRESILADLATAFVAADIGSLLASDVIERMEHFFAAVGWEESPTAVLTDLVTRRVLLLSGDQVTFTQASYLHLFAAKAAMRDASLLESMLERPLYYAPVLRGYASLARQATDLLRRVDLLLNPTQRIEISSSIYSKQPARAVPDNLEEILEKRLQAGVADDDLPPVDVDDNDDTPERELLPFPLMTDEDLSDIDRLAQSAELVSAVLRDSDEVTDLDLKVDVLRHVLTAWGHLADVLREDDRFKELIRQIQVQVFDKIESPRLRQLAEDFIGLLPSAVVASGISLSLASRKLIVILRRITDSITDDTDEPELRVAAAMLLVAIGVDNWEPSFAELTQRYYNTAVGQGFLFGTVGAEFQAAQAGSDAERRRRTLLVDIYLAGIAVNDGVRRAAIGSKFAQNLDATKRAEISRLEGGREG